MNKKEQIKDYIHNHNYFSLPQIAKDLSLEKKIIKDYLSQFKKNRIVFDAGYSIYSTIEKQFMSIKKSRVDTLLSSLKEKFPYTKFVIWNTQQLQPLYHHTQQHNITFIDVEKEAVQALYEAVVKEYRDAIIEKRNHEYFNSFDLSHNPVVIRCLYSRSPKKGHIPEIEKILVDMFIDLNKYKYIESSDYWGIWNRLFSEYRVKIGILRNYSKRRKCFKELFAQLTDISKTYRIDLCQIVENSGKRR